MIDVFNVIVGVLAGGAVTTGATITIEWCRERREARSLAHAFRGELLALRNIVDSRQYIEGLKTVIANIKQSQTPIAFPIRARREYFNVFKANVDKLGRLKCPLPERIADIYIKANAILEDIESLAADGMNQATANECSQFYTELLQLFEDSRTAAGQIADLIAKEYP